FLCEILLRLFCGFVFVSMRILGGGAGNREVLLLPFACALGVGWRPRGVLVRMPRTKGVGSTEGEGELTVRHHPVRSKRYI
ncbi:hypothetical protein K440DRAFT_623122, partial [Wilcoxina mikolae CBS 423.85]